MAYDSSADYFLKLDGIDGECTHTGHEKWLELESFSWGASQPSSGGFGAGQGGVARVSFQDFSFNQRMNAASPKLCQAMFEGKVFNKAKLVCRRRGGKDGKPINYLEVELGEVLVSSHSFSGSGTGEIPTEGFSLRFETQKTAYEQVEKGQKKGKIQTSWDSKQNKKV